MTNENLHAAVLGRVAPTQIERDALLQTAAVIMNEIERNAKGRGLTVSCVHVGSSARDTWCKGSNDIDIFIQFPKETSREDLETHGLALGKSVSAKHSISFAEHPYVVAEVNGYEVDVVPCYKLASAKEMQCAVDRTPFHNRYVKDKIGGYDYVRCVNGRVITAGDEVRLLKQFCKGVGVYGSDHKTSGFSGYLCELLVCQYGNFENVVARAAGWHAGTLIDLEKHMSEDLASAGIEGAMVLCVVDPVDGNRNVAAAVSDQKFYEFIHACRMYLKNPTIEAFFPPEAKEVNLHDLTDYIQYTRGTTLDVAMFNVPEGVNEDNYFPRLRKLECQLTSQLESEDFRVLSSDVWSDLKVAAIVFEMEVGELPRIKRQVGPPLRIGKACEQFLEAHPDAYVYGDRYAVDVERKHADSASLIQEYLRHQSVVENVVCYYRGGSKAEQNMPDTPEIFNEIEAANRLGPEFRKFLANMLGMKVR